MNGKIDLIKHDDDVKYMYDTDKTAQTYVTKIKLHTNKPREQSVALYL